jgi:energy-coupling factor transport system ATP-binding protein
MDSIIKTKDLWFAYEERNWILKGISIDIHQGEVISIIGPNGCGKTTLVKHFNGLLKPVKGKVFVNGIDTSKTSVAELSRIVGYVFQNPNHQIFSATVIEEATFGPKNFGIKNAEKAAISSLKEVGLLNKIKASPFILSHGEKERLSIASILSFDPKVLILDEPTTGQDATTTKRILKIVEKMKRREKTIIIITHDMEFVAECSDRVFVMNEGKVEKVGTPYQIFSDEKLLRKIKLSPPPVVAIAKALGINPLPLTIDDFVKRFENGAYRV